MSRAVGCALAAGVLGAIGLATVAPIEDLDVWWLLRSGAYMVETRSFPTTDPFSGTAFGAEWINHAWGFELLLYGVYRLGGLGGLLALPALFAIATFAVLYVGLRREGLGRPWALVAIGVGGLATHGFWAPRPQVVTYLGLVAFWTILRAGRDGRSRPYLWLPVLTAVWANLHGGFMIGVGLIGLCLVGAWLDRVAADGVSRSGQPDTRLAVAGVASLAAMFATPFHYRGVLFPLQVLGDRFAQAFISEWGSLPFHYPQVRLVEALVLLTLVAFWWAPRRCRVTDVLVLAAFLHLGLQAIRNLPLLVVIVIPILARALAETAAARRGLLSMLTGGRPRAAGLVVSALAVLLAIGWVNPLRRLPDLPTAARVADTFPEGAARFLERSRPAGPLFNDYGWGGYLIWRLYPDYRVSIDGRIAVHGPRGFADYLEVAEVRPRWRGTLDRLGARLVLVKARSPLAVVLKAAGDWQLLYEDGVAVVLGKRESRS
jgi:hypothetical protein